jgi:hypothetical protein
MPDCYLPPFRNGTRFFFIVSTFYLGERYCLRFGKALSSKIGASGDKGPDVRRAEPSANYLAVRKSEQLFWVAG